MAQQNIRLNGPDGNGIYGVWTKNASRRLVVHIHGLTHNARSFLEVLSADFFGSRGYDHFRPSLYERLPDSRKLPASTPSTHARDIMAILEHFKNDYDAIYLTGHSIGALATLIANPPGLKAISLWDPAFDITHFWSTGPYLSHMPERRQYQLDYGCVYVLGEEMVEEIKKYPDAKCQELAAQVKTPVQFIIPDETIFLASPHTSPENYRAKFTGGFDLARVKGANHTFSNAGNYPILLETTLKWFDAHG